MLNYKIIFTEEVKGFIYCLDSKSVEKILKTFDKVKLGLFRDYYAKMSGTKDFYECKVKTKDHWFRFITKHYKINDETTIIVLSGFKKKSNKIPQNEIKKAEKIYEKIFKGGHS